MTKSKHEPFNPVIPQQQPRSFAEALGFSQADFVAALEIILEQHVASIVQPTPALPPPEPEPDPIPPVEINVTLGEDDI